MQTTSLAHRPTGRMRPSPPSPPDLSDAMAPDPEPSVSQEAEATYGRVPNFLRTINEETDMPGAVYLAADAALMNGLLSPADQQIVLLELSRFNGSRYDAVVHARMALDAGIPSKVIDEVLRGQAPSNDRVAALVTATRKSCKERGWLPEKTQKALASRGIGRGELYEIFALIGMKMFSSFANHFASPELDAPLQETAARFDTLPTRPDKVERQRLFVG